MESKIFSLVDLGYFSQKQRKFYFVVLEFNVETILEYALPGRVKGYRILVTRGKASSFSLLASRCF